MEAKISFLSKAQSGKQSVRHSAGSGSMGRQMSRQDLSKKVDEYRSMGSITPRQKSKHRRTPMSL